MTGSKRKLEGRNILVVEDDAVNQEVVGEYLKLSGARVSVAKNGRSAVDLIREQKFDAVLMDMHMPEMGGIESTKIIRALPHLNSLPIIAVTAAITPIDRESCQKAGMDDFISKPIDPEELVKKLVYWVNPQRDSQAEAKASVSDPVSEFSKIGGAFMQMEGFDLTGLHKIMSDERAIIHLLKRFHNHNLDALNQTKTALDTQQVEAAKRMVHKLKGTAGNLGAVDLHRAATQLDSELSTGQWSETTWREFARSLQHALDEISRLT